MTAVPKFSFMADTLTRAENDLFTLNPWGDPAFHVEQLPCWITYTNPRTHEIIRGNLHQSPMYCGVIEGVGPRYCPSIEDKVVRFADKERHQVFLEPEGRHTLRILRQRGFHLAALSGAAGVSALDPGPRKV